MNSSWQVEDKGGHGGFRIIFSMPSTIISNFIEV
jgi:hypothetical protein